MNEAVSEPMAFNTVFSEEPGYLLCLTDGSVGDAESFISWGMKVIQKAVETGLSRILFDNRTFALSLSSLDIVLFAKKYEELNVALLGLRMAVLSNPLNAELVRLLETSLTNRSAVLKRFQTRPEALHWLLAEAKII